MTDGNAAEGTAPTGAVAPAGVKGAMAEFVGELTRFRETIETKLQAQENRMTMLDRKTAFRGRAPLSTAAETEAALADKIAETPTVTAANNVRPMTGAEYLERALKDRGLITLISPYEGAVNLYRTERFANAKQRLMAGAENPVCPWPRCAKPADECQIHHLEPWLHGGLTNIANLSTACAYHNGANDDDRDEHP